VPSFEGAEQREREIMFFKLMEVVFVLMAIAIVITQIVMPAIIHRPLFPFFRKEAKIKGELSDALQKFDEQELASKVEAVNKATQSIE
jgi:hypothetical protein